MSDSRNYESPKPQDTELQRQPQESPLYRDTLPDSGSREAQKPSDKTEVKLDSSNLDPAMKAAVKKVVGVMKTGLAQIADGMEAMERQRQQTQDYQRQDFDNWLASYSNKMLDNFKREMDEVGQSLPCRIAVDVQGFGPPGKFRPEIFKVTVPPRPEDVVLHDTNVMFKVHSDNPEREADLSNDSGEDKYVSGWEVAYWMMRRGGITRRDSAQA